MFQRLMSIIKSMFNKGMSKLETPEVLAEQVEMDLESNFKKVTEALTQSITTEKQLEQNIKKSSEELSTWEKRALVAVQQNNDDIARQCLAKKQELAQSLQALESQLSDQKRNTSMLRERHAELKNKLTEFKMKKSEMTARLKSSESMAKAQELVSGAGSGSSMDKWEQKIAMNEARAQAMREMSDVNQVDDKFKELDKHMLLNDELAALKASVGNTGPKLIVAQEPVTATAAAEEATVIDDAEIIDPDEKK